MDGRTQYRRHANNLPDRPFLEPPIDHQRMLRVLQRDYGLSILGISKSTKPRRPYSPLGFNRLRCNSIKAGRANWPDIRGCADSPAQVCGLLGTEPLQEMRRNLLDLRDTLLRPPAASCRFCKQFRIAPYGTTA